MMKIQAIIRPWLFCLSIFPGAISTYVRRKRSEYRHKNKAQGTNDYLPVLVVVANSDFRGFLSTLVRLLAGCLCMEI